MVHKRQYHTQIGVPTLIMTASVDWKSDGFDSGSNTAELDWKRPAMYRLRVKLLRNRTCDLGEIETGMPEV